MRRGHALSVLRQVSFLGGVARADFFAPHHPLRKARIVWQISSFLLCTVANDTAVMLRARAIEGGLLPCASDNSHT